MRSLCFLFFCFLILFCFPINCTAHSGGTDAFGGHYDNNDGGYHYHHGYSAHDHPNGNCPYNKNDKSENRNNVSSNYNGQKRKTSFWDITKAFFESLFFSLFVSIGFSLFFVEFFEKHLKIDGCLLHIISFIVFFIILFVCRVVYILKQ